MTLRLNSSWVSEKKPKVIQTSWNRVTQRADAELPFEAYPDVDGDAEHGERDRQRAGAEQLLRDLARHRLDRVEAGVGIARRDHRADLARRLRRRRLAAFRQRHADADDVGRAELLQVRLAVAEPVHPVAQLVELRRLAEGHADALAADEVDAEIEAAGEDQGDRRRGDQDRQDQREVAPFHEIDVGVVGDELQQLHMCSSLGRARRTQSATSMRVTLTAVNTEVMMPISSTTAKPRIGPEPK